MSPRGDAGIKRPGRRSASCLALFDWKANHSGIEAGPTGCATGKELIELPGVWLALKKVFRALRLGKSLSLPGIILPGCTELKIANVMSIGTESKMYCQIS